MWLKDVIEFTGFKWFYDLYKPLSPYGIDQKENWVFYKDGTRLEMVFDITEKTTNFYKYNKNQAAKIEYHLKKIDRLNSLDKEEFDAADILLIKRLLNHYNKISSLLGEALKYDLNFEFDSHSLLDEIAVDNDYSDGFYISSGFSAELRQVREQVAQIDDQLEEIKLATFSCLEDKYGIDFENRDFVLCPKENIEKFDSDEVYCEFYDSNMILAKPVFGQRYTELLIEKEKLLNKETEQEKQVLQQLSKAVLKQKHNLLLYIKVIGQLDAFMARARLVIDLNLSRPNVISGKSMKIVEGVYLPLQQTNQELGMNYTPLNAKFKSNAILLSGSNMGGKTVLLRSIGFLQLLTQMGFWVRARHFETRLFDEIHILDQHGDTVEGLSSFGQEIYKLSQALSDDGKRKMFLADEMAKTTNATEAKAILFGTLKKISSLNNINGYFSTHFVNMPKIDGVCKFKMKGLNKDAFREYYQTEKASAIQDKIKVINSFMQYEPVKDDGSAVFDALNIAELLGLDDEVIKNANDFLNNKHGKIKP